MMTRKFHDLTLPLLGFGAMRLPLLADGSGRVDEARTRDMVAYAMQHGLNYFDTAYPYHGGESERIMGRILADYPRESYLLATKFPSHVAAAGRTPASIFEEQLEKCGVSYFDFYLLHNVCETTTPTFCDPKLGIVDYLLEQRRLGRIRYLGFSSHGQMDNLRAFLDLYGKEMAFCQIQLNYLDWSLQDAKGKVELLNARHIPIWVMEPLRGGKLCTLDEEAMSELQKLRPQESMSGWAFRFLQSIPGVTMILSGMSDMQQLQENIETFADEQPLNEDEMKTLTGIGRRMSTSVPCTACRYCIEHCPRSLDIPELIRLYNDMVYSGGSFSARNAVNALPADKQPSACIGCGHCQALCPQQIHIPDIMRDLARRISE